MRSRALPFIPMNRTDQAVVAVWLVITAFIGYLFISMASSRQSVEQRVRDQAESYARLVEEHASATFNRANIALLAVMDHLAPADLLVSRPLTESRRTEIENLLRSQLQRTRGIVALPLTNAEGIIIADPLGAPPETSLRDRQHFQTLRGSTKITQVISSAVRGRVSGKWGVVFARRLDLPDGRFGGMLSANLGLDANFTDFYATLSLGKDGAVSLRDPEDRLMVRYPVIEERLGKPVAASGEIHARLQAGDADGIIVVASAIDNIERVFAFRRLKDYPVYAAVGLSLDEALAGWRRDRNVAALGALLVILAGAFITVTVRRKERAENRSKMLAMIVESSQDAISSADLNGIISSWNGGAQRLYGYTAEEALGQHYSLIVPPEQRNEYELTIENCRAGRSTTNRDSQRIAKDGRRLDVSVTASPLCDTSDRVVAFSVIGRDIGERKREEQALIAAKQFADQANVAKSRFLAAASHDLRQPIYAMSLLLDTLRRSDLKEEQLRLIHSIETASHSLTELLDSLLDLSKLDAGAVSPKLERVSVVEFLARLDESFSPLAIERGLRFKLHFPKRFLTLHTDERLLNDVLGNIVGNALKYTMHGGISVGLRMRQDCCAIQVWDTGIGIRHDDVDHIFEEFYQIDNPHRDRAKGIGLGLAIAKRICGLLGYGLSCRSQRGRGSVFEIHLPLTALIYGDIGQIDPIQDNQVDLEAFRGKRLVLVEDDELVANALMGWLTWCGIEVSLHDSGENALADPQTLAADYFIADYQLAGNMNGLEFLEAVRQRATAPFRAVVVSGYTSGMFIEAAAKTRWPVLFKPADPLRILATLAAS